MKYLLFTALLFCNSAFGAEPTALDKINAEIRLMVGIASSDFSTASRHGVAALRLMANYIGQEDRFNTDGPTAGGLKRAMEVAAIDSTVLSPPAPSAPVQPFPPAPTPVPTPPVSSSALKWTLLAAALAALALGWRLRRRR